MKIFNLKTNEINQNGYHINLLTKNKIGALYIFPMANIPNDCLACDGYVLKISDYNKLFLAIGNKFNVGDEATDEFRIPDYNISKRFLQPGDKPGEKINAGLPNIVGDLGQARVDNASGAFRSVSRYTIGNNGDYQTAGAMFNASWSNSIYGASKTVQPASQIVSVCIKYK